MTRVRDALSGKQCFITGATGFLGTALVERLLRGVPDCRVVLLIRPGRRATPAQRATREILKNDCFDLLRSQYGDRFDAEVASRVTAVAGDVATEGLGTRPGRPAGPLGVRPGGAFGRSRELRLAARRRRRGQPARSVPGSRRRCSLPEPSLPEQGRTGPEHFIPVSTAYVAGTHQGEAKEELLDANPFTVEVDWRHEVEAARRQRGDADAESRRPERLAGFAKDARGELGGAGLHLLAERAERLREDWVRKQMVRIGRARAQSLGWPDAYPYTKALGERALVSQFGDVLPMTIVRPSIIESSLAEPRPGWIRGFRMAEPIIVSYARGPPARVSRCARRGDRRHTGRPGGGGHHRGGRRCPICRATGYVGPTVYHVASGVRNPFRYGRLVELVQAWFTEHPLYDSDGQPIVVPAWSFPGRGRVQRQLSRASKAMDVAEKVVGSLPIRGRQAAWMAALEEQHLLADRALGYVELYGAYTETEARYRVDRLIALWDRMDPDDRQTFCFDPAAVDWAVYVRDDPPAVGHRARPGADDADPFEPVRPGPTGPGRPSSPPTGTWPPSTSRTP